MIGTACVIAIVAAAIVVAVLLENRRFNRSVMPPVDLPSHPGADRFPMSAIPDASESAIVPWNKVDPTCDRMRGDLQRKLGEDAHVECQTYLLLSGDVGIIATAHESRRRKR